jgi:hypothetical protein
MVAVRPPRERVVCWRCGRDMPRGLRPGGGRICDVCLPEPQLLSPQLKGFLLVLALAAPSLVGGGSLAFIVAERGDVAGYVRDLMLWGSLLGYQSTIALGIFLYREPALRSALSWLVLALAAVYQIGFIVVLLVLLAHAPFGGGW